MNGLSSHDGHTRAQITSSFAGNASQFADDGPFVQAILSAAENKPTGAEAEFKKWWDLGSDWPAKAQEAIQAYLVAVNDKLKSGILLSHQNPGWTSREALL